MIDVLSLTTLPDDLSVFLGAPLSKLVEVARQLGTTLTDDETRRLAALMQFRVLQRIRERTNSDEGMHELALLISGKSGRDLTIENPRFLGMLEGMYDFLSMANKQPDALQVIKTYLPYSWEVLNLLDKCGASKMLIIRLYDLVDALDMQSRERLHSCLTALEKVTLILMGSYAEDPELRIVVCQACETIDNVEPWIESIICGRCKNPMSAPNQMDEAVLRKAPYVSLDEKGRDLMNRIRRGEFIC